MNSDTPPLPRSSTTLTLYEACAIQKRQMAVFSGYLDSPTAQQFAQRVSEATNIPEGLDLEEELPLEQVHAMVPCGLLLESILREFTDAELIPPS